MTAYAFLLAGVAAALGASLLLGARPSRRGAVAEDERVEIAGRELTGLREQLAEGELTREEYLRFRDQVAVGLALPASGARRRAERGRGRLWAAWWAAVLVALAALVVPAVRDRAPGAGPTGNDFIDRGADVRGGDSAPLSADRLAAALREARRLDDVGKPAEAVPMYRMAVGLLPDRADLRAQLGFALARAGSTEDALAQLREAVRRDPRLPAARVYLGAVLWKLGRRAEARTHWQQYLTLEPNGAAAKFVRRMLAQR